MMGLLPPFFFDWRKVDAIETHDDMWDLMAKFQLWSIPTFISMSVAADEVNDWPLLCTACVHRFSACYVCECVHVPRWRQNFESCLAIFYYLKYGVDSCWMHERSTLVALERPKGFKPLEPLGHMA